MGLGDGVWGVRVPDLVGCYGGGTTADGAVGDVASFIGGFRKGETHPTFFMD